MKRISNGVVILKVTKLMFSQTGMQKQFQSSKQKEISLKEQTGLKVIKELRVKQIWKLSSILTMLKMRLSKVSGKQIIQHTGELILEGYIQ